MPADVRFGIALPQLIGDGEFDPTEFREYVERAEALGFESAWTQENVLSPGPLLAPIELMTFAAACSTRLRLGCVVFVTPLHNPVHLAKHLSTLDQLSRGRIEVGVGIGGPGRQYSAFDGDGTRLVARFNEGLRLMKALWTEPRVDFAGDFWQLAGATMEPKPFQKPHPPIWFGARHPDALQRAVRHGTGFFGAGSTNTADFAEQAALVRQLTADREAGAPHFPIAKRLYIAVGDDPDRAHARAVEALAGIYGGEFGRHVLAGCVIGRPDACIDGVREVVAAGAELVLLNPLFDEREQMERLAAEVIPHVTNTMR
jgi:alkanesulfonate monooxygenase SsuD/methylene tetrahydromethanopterin reductase-like flavin-dependent oxidoreductase (luciferase family)